MSIGEVMPAETGSVAVHLADAAVAATACFPLRELSVAMFVPHALINNARDHAFICYIIAYSLPAGFASYAVCIYQKTTQQV
jgi:hypothetical protein